MPRPPSGKARSAPPGTPVSTHIGAAEVAIEPCVNPPPHYRRICSLRSVEAALAVESERMVGVETGGVLAGFIDPRLDALVIVAASGPGSRALHLPALFNRDPAYCQAWLDKLAAASSGRVDFVGEWHKHREPDPTPSPTDRDTFTRLAANADCHLTRIALLIAGTAAVGRWPRRRDEYVRANGWSVRADGLVARDVEWLPDEAYSDLCASAFSSLSLSPLEHKP